MGSPKQLTTALITIKLGHLSFEQIEYPPFVLPIPAINISEGIYHDLYLATFTVTAYDINTISINVFSPNNDYIIWVESMENSSNAFIIWLNGSLNFETNDVIKFLIIANNGRFESFQEVTIFVEDVNEPPAFLDEFYEVEIQEDAFIGSYLVTVQGFDPDLTANPILIYTIDPNSNNNNSFVIDQSGVVKLVTILNYVNRNFYNLTVILSDGVKNASTSVIINVTPCVYQCFVFGLNKHIPIISNIPMNNIYEGEYNQLYVTNFTVTSYDHYDNYTISVIIYDFLTSLNLTARRISNYNNLFYLELNGVLNFENNNAVHYLVEASNGNLKSYAEGLILVLNVNEPPMTLDESYYVEISEDAFIGSYIVTVKGFDPDIDDNPTLTYTIDQLSNEDKLFEIDLSSGVVQLKKTLYHTHKNYYILSVIVSDGIYFVSTLVNINVTTCNYKCLPSGLNNYMPIISSIPAVNVFEGAYNNYYLTNYTVADYDSTNISINIYNFNNDLNITTRRLNIYSNLFVVELSGNLDFEINDVVHYFIEATDGVLNSLVEGLLFIINVNEPPMTLDESYYVEIREDAFIGSFVVTVIGFDPDIEDNAILAYAIDPFSNSDNKFVIDPSSGVVKLMKTLNNTKKSFYNLSVTVSDRVNLVSTAVNINVTPCYNECFYISLNKPAPVISSIPPINIMEGEYRNYYLTNFTVTNYENVTLSINVYDFSSNLNLTVKRLNSYSNVFFVELTGNLNFENGNIVHYLVKASDGNLMAVAEGSIFVLDMNEPPMTLDESYYVEISEDAFIGSFVVTVEGFDPDVDDNAILAYAIDPFSNSDNKFVIDASSGVVKLMKTLNYTKKSFYNLSVTVSDGVNLVSTSVNINVTRCDSECLSFGLNKPVPVLSSIPPVNILEGVYRSYYLTNFTVTDYENVTLSVNVYDFGSNLNLTVKRLNSYSNVFFVELTGNLNFENGDIVHYLVEASDGNLMAVAEGSIFVLNVNEPPMTLDESYYVEIREDAFIGSFVVTVEGFDPDVDDNAILAYAIDPFSNSDNKFVIDASSGVVKLMKTLNYTKKSFYNLSVTVSDGVNLVSTSVNINVTRCDSECLSFGLNKPVPVLSSIPPVNILEGVYRSYYLTNFTVTDYENVTLSVNVYDFGSNLNLTVKRLNSYSNVFFVELTGNLNFENGDIVHYLVEASDGNLMAVAEGSIFVLNVNEPPMTLDESYYVEIREDAFIGSFVVTVEGFDPDVDDNAILAYAIDPFSNSDNKFVIDASSGVVKLMKTLNYTKKSFYNLSVTVSDGVNLVSTSVNINVTRCDSECLSFGLNKPVPVLSSIPPVNILEGVYRSYYLTNFTVTDYENVTLSVNVYDFGSNLNLTVKRLNSYSNVFFVELTGNLNFENGDIVHYLVEASDGNLMAVAEGSIFVLNVNEPPMTLDESYYVEIREDAFIGSFVVTVEGFDPDVDDNAILAYAIDPFSNSDNKFVIDASSGVVKLMKTLNYTKKSFYNLSVTVSDGVNLVSTSVNINVTRCDSECLSFGLNKPVPVLSSIPPVNILEGVYRSYYLTNFTVTDYENVTLSVNVYDFGSNLNLTVKRLNSYSNVFFVELTGNLNFENGDIVHYLVEASDGNLMAVAEGSIFVLNVNEPPMTLDESYYVEIREDAFIGSFVVTVEGFDPDVDDNAILAYAIDPFSNSDNKFVIDASSGVVKLMKTLNYTKKSFYNLSVTVSDGVNLVSTSVNINVTRCDSECLSFGLNKPVPVLSSIPPVNILEGVYRSYYLTNFTVTDYENVTLSVNVYDFGSNLNLTVKRLNSYSNVFFVELTGNLNFENGDIVHYLVEASDGNLMAVAEGSIFVLNVNEPPMTLDESYYVEIREDAFIGSFVVTVEGFDPDVDDNAILAYAIDPFSNSDNKFVIDASSGVVKLMKTLNYTKKSFYNLSVTVSDGVNLVSTSVNINVTRCDSECLSFGLNKPVPVLSSIPPVNILEGVYRSYYLTNFTVTDYENVTLSVNVYDFGSNLNLTVKRLNSYSNVFFVELTGNLNFENGDIVHYLVEASDGNLMAVAEGSIFVLNVNEPPMTLDESYYVEIREDAFIGSFVVTVEGFDPDVDDNAILAYAIDPFSNSDNKFVIDASSGVVKLMKTLNYTKKSFYNLSVTVSDGVNLVSTSVNINVTRCDSECLSFGLNKPVPVLSSIPPVNILEGVYRSYYLTNFTVTDYENVTLSVNVYDFGSNLNLTVKRLNSYSNVFFVELTGNLNFENGDIVHYLVEASDGNLMAVAEGSIFVLNVNEPPMTLDESYYVEIREDAFIGSFVVTVEGFDPDVDDNAILAYAIDPFSNSDNKFVIDASSGVVKLMKTLNYTKKSFYNLSVTVSDGVNLVSTSVNINVTRCDSECLSFGLNKPVPVLSSIPPVNILEGVYRSYYLTNFTVTDYENVTLSVNVYDFGSNLNLTVKRLNSYSNVFFVELTGNLNFENGDIVHYLVEASDGNLMAVAEGSIFVLNVNEPPMTLDESYYVEIREDAFIGSFVVTVEGFDPDVDDNAILAYAIDPFSNSDNKFVIDASSGVVKLMKTLNYTKKSFYNLSVTVSDGVNLVSTSVNINVTRCDSECLSFGLNKPVPVLSSIPPVNILEGVYRSYYLTNFTVTDYENVTLSVNVYDFGSNLNLTVKRLNSYSNVFFVELTGNLNFENGDIVHYLVEASDGNLMAVAEGSIFVLNVNEPPMTLDESYYVEIREDAFIGSFVVTVEGFDPDVDDNAILAYAIDPFSNSDNKFVIDASSGVVKLMKTLNYTKKSFYNLSVTVSDGVNLVSTSVNINVTRCDSECLSFGLNKPVPVLSSIPPVNILEGVYRSYYLTNFTVTDYENVTLSVNVYDFGSNLNLTVKRLNSYSNVFFVELTGNLNFENGDIVHYLVEASDGNLMAVAEGSIFVLNVNEPPMTLDESYYVEIREDAFIGSFVVTVEGFDPDVDDNAILAYAIDPFSNSDNKFVIDASSGVVKLMKTLNYTKKSFYNLSVTVSDGVNLVSTSVNINVTRCDSECLSFGLNKPVPVLSSIPPVNILEGVYRSYYLTNFTVTDYENVTLSVNVYDFGSNLNLTVKRLNSYSNVFFVELTGNLNFENGDIVHYLVEASDGNLMAVAEGSIFVLNVNEPPMTLDESYYVEIREDAFIGSFVVTVEGFDPDVDDNAILAYAIDPFSNSDNKFVIDASSGVVKLMKTLNYTKKSFYNLSVTVSDGVNLVSTSVNINVTRCDSECLSFGLNKPVPVLSSIPPVNILEGVYRSYYLTNFTVTDYENVTLSVNVYDFGSNLNLTVKRLNSYSNVFFVELTGNLNFENGDIVHYLVEASDGNLMAVAEGSIFVLNVNEPPMTLDESYYVEIREDAFIGSFVVTVEGFDPDVDDNAILAYAIDPFSNSDNKFVIDASSGVVKLMKTLNYTKKSFYNLSVTVSDGVNLVSTSVNINVTRCDSECLSFGLNKPVPVLSSIPPVNILEGVYRSYYLTNFTVTDYENVTLSVNVYDFGSNLNLTVKRLNSYSNVFFVELTGNLNFENGDIVHYLVEASDGNLMAVAEGSIFVLNVNEPPMTLDESYYVEIREDAFIGSFVVTVEGFDPDVDDNAILAYAIDPFSNSDNKFVIDASSGVVKLMKTLNYTKKSFYNLSVTVSDGVNLVSTSVNINVTRCDSECLSFGLNKPVPVLSSIPPVNILEGVYRSYYLTNFTVTDYENVTLSVNVYDFGSNLNLTVKRLNSYSNVFFVELTGNLNFENGDIVHYLVEASDGNLMAVAEGSIFVLNVNEPPMTLDESYYVEIREDAFIGSFVVTVEGFDPDVDDNAILAYAIDPFSNSDNKFVIDASSGVVKLMKTLNYTKKSFYNLSVTVSDGVNLVSTSVNINVTRCDSECLSFGLNKPVPVLSSIPPVNILEGVYRSYYLTNFTVTDYENVTLSVNVYDFGSNLNLTVKRLNSYSNVFFVELTGNLNFENGDIVHYLVEASDGNLMAVAEGSIFVLNVNEPPMTLDESYYVEIREDAFIGSFVVTVEGFDPDVDDNAILAYAIDPFSNSDNKFVIDASSGVVKLMKTLNYTKKSFYNLSVTVSDGVNLVSTSVNINVTRCDSECLSFGLNKPVPVLSSIPPVNILEGVYRSYYLTNFTVTDYENVTLSVNVYDFGSNLNLTVKRLNSYSNVFFVELTGNLNFENGDIVHYLVEASDGNLMAVAEGSIFVLNVNEPPMTLDESYYVEIREDAFIGSFVVTVEGFDPDVDDNAILAYAIDPFSNSDNKFVIDASSGVVKLMKTLNYTKKSFYNLSVTVSDGVNLVSTSVNINVTRCDSECLSFGLNKPVPVLSSIPPVNILEGVYRSYYLTNFTVTDYENVTLSVNVYDFGSNLNLTVKRLNSYSNVFFVELTGNLNFENGDIVHYLVEASDGNLMAVAEGSIFVLNVNEPPMTLDESYYVEIREDAFIGSFVVTVEGFDPDVDDNAILAYAIDPFSNSDNKFVIDASSGVVKLMKTLNYTKKSFYNLSVTVSDGVNLVSTSVNINVTRCDSECLSFGLNKPVPVLSSIPPVNILEGVYRSYYLTNFTVTDYENVTLSVNVYDFGSNLNLTVKRLNSYSNVFFVELTGNLNFENGDIVHYLVEASDGNLMAVAEGSIFVLNVNEPPMTLDESYYVEIREDAFIGSFVVTVEGFDPDVDDNAILAYAIDPFSNSDNKFVIDASSGVVKLMKTLNYTKKSFYNLSVTVSDGVNLVSTSVNINVTRCDSECLSFGLNKPVPVLSSIPPVNILEGVYRSYYLTNFTVTDYENVTLSVNVYDFGSNLNLTVKRLNSYSNVFFVELTGNLNFENGDIVHYLVEASDGNLMAVAEGSIFVLNVNEPPMTLDESYYVEIREDAFIGSFVVTVEGFDPDVDDNAILAYAIDPFSNSDNKFVIDASSGVVKLMKTLNYTKKSFYNLSVTVSDGVNLVSTSVNINVTRCDSECLSFGLNKPVPVLSSIPPVNILEGVYRSYYLTNFTVTDYENVTLSVNVYDFGSNLNLTVKRLNSYSNVFFVELTGNLNFENGDIVHYLVEASDGNLMAVAEGSIFVLNVNEPPMTLDESYYVEIREDAFIGSFVVTVEGFDPDVDDNAILAYAIDPFSNSDNKFVIDASSGVVKLMKTLNYTKKSFYNLSVTVSDGVNLVSTSVNINVTRCDSECLSFGLNKPVPVLSSIPPVNILEGVYRSYYLTNFTVTDYENVTLSVNVYDFGSNLNLTVKRLNSYSNVFFVELTGNLNFENGDIVHYLVEASDGNLMAVAEGSIFVLNVNEPPMTLDESYYVEIREDAFIGSFVVTVEGFDPDVDDNAILAYAIDPFSNSDNKFVIDASSGVVKLMKTLNYTKKSFYNLSVTVSDGVNLVSTSVNINVTRCDSECLSFGLNKPVPVLSSIPPVNILEGVYRSYYLTNFTVTDYENVTLSVNVYDFGSNLNLTVKRLNSYSNVFFVELTGNLNFENGDIVHYLVEASDGNLMAVAEGSIFVLNVNEPPMTLDESYYVEIREDAFIGSFVVTVEGFDPDVDDNAILAYAIDPFSNSDNKFVIDASSGVVKLMKTLNYTKKSFYNLSVTVSDGVNLVSTSVNINVTRCDSECLSFGLNKPVPVLSSIPPVNILEGVYRSYYLTNFTVTDYENVTLSVNVYDFGSNLNLTVKRLNSYSNVFFVELTGNLNFENGDIVHYLVEASDGNLMAVAEGSIFVLNVNEPPMTLDESYYVEIREDAFIGSFVVTVEGFDPDVDDNAILAYAIDPFSNSDNKFVIDASSGVVKLMKTLNYTKKSFYNLSVTVSDGVNLVSTSVNINVTRCDSECLSFGLNKPVPVLSSIPPVNILEGVYRSYYLTNFTVTDYENVTLSVNVYDFGSNLNLTVKRLNSYSNVFFVELTGNLNFENGDIVHYLVEASDGNLMAVAEGSIFVLNVNEPPMTLDESYYVEIREDAFIGSFVVTVEGFDPDVDDNAILAYAIDPFSNSDNKFVIDASSGVVKLMKTLNYTKKSFYNLSVTVSDGVNLVSTSVNINVTRCDSECLSFGLNKPVPVLSSIPLVSVSEGMYNSFFLTSFTVSDFDNDNVSVNIIGCCSNFSLTARNIDNGLFVVELNGFLSSKLSDVISYTVVAFDGFLNSYAVGMILVNPVLEANHNPYFLVLDYFVALNVYTSYVTTLLASDEGSCCIGELNYKSSNEAFNVSNSGVVSVLNWALIGNSTDFFVNVFDNNVPSLSSLVQAHVFVTVIGILEPMPEYFFYNVSVKEDILLNSYILCVNATIPNSYGNVEFFMVDQEAESFFDIGFVSGIVILIKNLDYEIEVAHKFVILLRNSLDHQKTSIATVLVNIINVNDVPPVFLSRSKDIFLDESTSIGQLVSILLAFDKDSVNLTYQIIDGNSEYTFSVNQLGEIRVNNTLNATKSSFYNLVCIAQDGTFFSDKIDIRITIRPSACLSASSLSSNIVSTNTFLNFSQQYEAYNIDVQADFSSSDPDFGYYRFLPRISWYDVVYNPNVNKNKMRKYLAYTITIPKVQLNNTRKRRDTSGANQLYTYPISFGTQAECKDPKNSTLPCNGPLPTDKNIMYQLSGISSMGNATVTQVLSSDQAINMTTTSQDIVTSVSKTYKKKYYFVGLITIGVLLLVTIIAIGYLLFCLMVLYKNRWQRFKVPIISDKQIAFNNKFDVPPLPSSPSPFKYFYSDVQKVDYNPHVSNVWDNVMLSDITSSSTISFSITQPNFITQPNIHGSMSSIQTGDSEPESKFETFYYNSNTMTESSIHGFTSQTNTSIESNISNQNIYDLSSQTSCSDIDSSRSQSTIDCSEVVYTNLDSDLTDPNDSDLTDLNDLNLNDVGEESTFSEDSQDTFDASRFEDE
ncbi:protocadherin Fat 4 isoform X2 [Hydra vulgaris]|uniref:Protocadherin Fat 4 isoform X2 n=1 Tax=Hydra vulgaris TaxID=6087 RepID=A0ABM4BEP9_HYDVU